MMSSGCLILDNIEALASSREMINPECPNGCLSNGDKCHCYHDYAGYREAHGNWNLCIVDIISYDYINLKR